MNGSSAFRMRGRILLLAEIDSTVELVVTVKWCTICNCHHVGSSLLKGHAVSHLDVASSRLLDILLGLVCKVEV